MASDGEYKDPLAPTRARILRHGRCANHKWSAEEDALLKEIISKQENPEWPEIGKMFRNKTVHQIIDRWARVLDPALVKGSWTFEEDAMIVKWVEEHGPKEWAVLAELLPGRISKQCRERWHNHLSPTVRKSDWTQEEDEILIQWQKQWGNKWSRIAALLPGRTDNAVKNRWNSSLKRRLEHVESGGAGAAKKVRRIGRCSRANVVTEEPKEVFMYAEIDFSPGSSRELDSSPVVSAFTTVLSPGMRWRVWDPGDIDMEADLDTYLFSGADEFCLDSEHGENLSTSVFESLN
jgi:hypothetical protein